MEFALFSFFDTFNEKEQNFKLNWTMLSTRSQVILHGNGDTVHNLEHIIIMDGLQKTKLFEYLSLMHLKKSGVVIVMQMMRITQQLKIEISSHRCSQNQVKSKKRSSRPQTSYISRNITIGYKVYLSVSARRPHEMILWAACGPPAVVCPPLF